MLCLSPLLNHSALFHPTPAPHSFTPHSTLSFNPHPFRTRSLQASNVLLKSSASDGRGVVAKVADFGLSVKMDITQTHMSNLWQVRRLMKWWWWW